MAEGYWLLAKMVRSYDQLSSRFNAGYAKGQTVYVWNQPVDCDGEEYYRIFNGSSRYGSIELTVKEAMQYIQLTRRNGKTIRAPNQSEISDQYAQMLDV